MLITGNTPKLKAVSSSNQVLVPKSTDLESVLFEHAEFIKERIQKINASFIEIGLSLRYVREILGDEKHGYWTRWLQKEFSWSERTAQRLIKAVNTLDDFGVLDSLDTALIQRSALYRLTSSTTPPLVKQIAFKRMLGGEAINSTMVSNLVADFSRFIETAEVATGKKEVIQQLLERYPELTADSIENLSIAEQYYPEQFEEIQATGALDMGDKQIPITQARADDFNQALYINPPIDFIPIIVFDVTNNGLKMVYHNPENFYSRYPKVNEEMLRNSPFVVLRQSPFSFATLQTKIITDKSFM